MSLYFCYLIMLASDFSSTVWESRSDCFNLIIYQFLLIQSSLLACIDSIQFRSSMNYVMYCFFLSVYFFYYSSLFRSIYIALLFAFYYFYFRTASYCLICSLFVFVFQIYSNSSSSLNFLLQYYLTAGSFSVILHYQLSFSASITAIKLFFSSICCLVSCSVFSIFSDNYFSCFAISFFAVCTSLTVWSLSYFIILI